METLRTIPGAYQTDNQKGVCSTNGNSKQTFFIKNHAPGLSKFLENKAKATMGVPLKSRECSKSRSTKKLNHC